MNEAFFYNAIAIAKHGDYHGIKKSHAGHATWADSYRAMRETGEPLLPDPETSFEELLRSNVRLILFSDGTFPPRLREIPHPPFALYIKGDPLALLHDPSLAVVGTRRATPAGKETARHFAHELAETGFAIVSGLAFGVDAAAHAGCLEASGATAGPAIAVLAGGLREISPRNNEQLGRAIVERGGAVVSEYPFGESPLKTRFIERNRIVSGIARGTLIIEAPLRSGALSTARFALEQNRDVFVLPGNIAQENFMGSNRLIQQGAALVTSSKDILETYGMVKERRAARAAQTARELAALGPEERLVMDVLTTADTFLDVDKIIIMTRLEPRIVNRSLTLLLMNGLIREEIMGGYAVRECARAREV